jgi:hypothetical protein
MSIEQVSTAGPSRTAAFTATAAPAAERQKARVEQQTAQELRPSPAADTSNETQGRRTDEAQRPIPELGAAASAGRPDARRGTGSTLDIVV